MAFTVTWTPTAEQALTNLWLKSRSRLFISEAAHRIDELLRTDPTTAGESRTETCRVLFVDPLAVKFLVFEPDCRVLVFAVWSMGRRR